MSGKEIIDFRLMVSVETPQPRTNEVQPVPGEIIARRKVDNVIMEAKLEPKWMKFKGITHSHPQILLIHSIHITIIIIIDTNNSNNTVCSLCSNE